MSDWRSDFNTMYKLVKSYCNISDSSIAKALYVTEDSVRQYSGKRKTMPNNIDKLCILFQEKIGNLTSAEKKQLLFDIQNNLHLKYEHIKCDDIAAYISALLKQCHSNEKAHTAYRANLPTLNNATGHTKAVVFDFDGTLTISKARTTWESLWEMLGYDVQECRDLHKKFDQGELTHSEWCDKTAERFIEKGLSRQQLIKYAKKTRLIPGCKETLQTLKNKSIMLYIVSGSIKEIIETALGSNCSFFSEIKANEFVFNTQNSVLEKIIGTEYDFDGKVTYIDYIANRLNISTSDILFIGNSNNDVWVHQSGARTLCINPIHTNYHDETIWHNTIVECKNLNEILEYIQ